MTLNYKILNRAISNKVLEVLVDLVDVFSKRFHLGLCAKYKEPEVSLNDLH